MGRLLLQPFKTEGLQFGKLLGSGRDFGLMPDWSTYIFLGVWENAEAAQSFSRTSLYAHLQQGTEQTATLYLQPQRAHGLWDGQNPFGTPSPHLPITQSSTAPVAVLTRATIRLRALPDFWRHVPQARQRLNDYRDDLLFAIGVGEVPLMQQCTISVWRNPAAVDRYAYRQSGHREIVRLTRERRWYSEELFARFGVVQADGSLFERVNEQLRANRADSLPAAGEQPGRI